MTEAEKFLEDYLNYLEIERNRSPKTRENYGRYLKNFLASAKIRTLRDITEGSIRKFRVALARRPARPSSAKGYGRAQQSSGGNVHALKKVTQSYYVIAIRNFLKYLVKRDCAPLAPDKIELPKIPSRQIEVLAYEEVERLLAAPKGSAPRALRDRAILETLFSTGLRLSELCALDRHAGFARGEITVRGKGDKLRVVFFSARAMGTVKKYLEARGDTDPALFLSYTRGGKPLGRISPRAVERLVAERAIEAGISMRVHPHHLRHCLHPDTHIFLPHRLLRAKELYETKTRVASFDFSQLRLSSGKIIGKEKHFADKLLSIWADGYELVCSPNHRLFTVGQSGVEEVFARDLKIGDWVAGIRRIRVDGDTQRSRGALDPRMWRYFGYVIGDGTVSERRRGIIVVDKDRQKIEFYRNLLISLGYQPTIVKKRDATSYCLCLYSKKLVCAMRRNGFVTIKNQKRVPPGIFKASKEEIRAFLAGFYDAEGNEGKGGVKMFSSSKFMLKEIQMLLLMLGIDARLYERSRSVKLPQGKTVPNTIYILQILRLPDQLRFQKTIPTLKNITPSLKKDALSDKVPVRLILKKIYFDLGKDGWKKFGRWLKADNHIDIYRYVGATTAIIPTKDVLRNIIAALKRLRCQNSSLDMLERLVADENIKWLRVKKIKKVDYDNFVYDFTVAPHHTLITDGFISHNSFATDLLMNGADLRSVQELLGHANVATTQVYTHLTNQTLRDAHKAFHGRRRK